MRKEQVKFTYKNGFSKTKFHNVSDKHLEILKRDICKEQLKRKEAELYGNPEQLTFRKKLRRFIRRVNGAVQYHAETTVLNSIVGSEQAATVNYLGLEE